MLTILGSLAEFERELIRVRTGKDALAPRRTVKAVELPFRHLADPCLVLVHRQLQLAHDLAQVVRRRFGVAPPAQDHRVVGIGDQASAETSLKAELLPPQHDLGRKPKLTPHQRHEAIQRRDRGESLGDIARTYNVSPSTISRLTG